MPLFSISQDIGIRKSETWGGYSSAWMESRNFLIQADYSAFNAQPQLKSICLGLINPLGHPTLRQRHAQAAHYCETPCDIWSARWGVTPEFTPQNSIGFSYKTSSNDVLRPVSSPPIHSTIYTSALWAIQGTHSFARNPGTFLLVRGTNYLAAHHF